MVYNRLIEYLEVNNWINNVQHDFRSNKSVTTASISRIESKIDSIDKDEETIGILMDLSKFDCVERKLLLLKLQNLGIEEECLEFFKS